MEQVVGKGGRPCGSEVLARRPRRVPRELAQAAACRLLPGDPRSRQPRPAPPAAVSQENNRDVRLLIDIRPLYAASFDNYLIDFELHIQSIEFNLKQ